MVKKTTAVIYVCICLVGLLGFLDFTLRTVYAQTHIATVENTQYEHNSNREYDPEEDRIERHLDYIDKRLDDDSSRISTMMGAGSGALTALTVLSFLNLIATRKKSE